MKYTLAIAHRVWLVLSKTAAIFRGKFEIVKAITTLLAHAVRGINVKLIMILDGFLIEYGKLIDEVFRKWQMAAMDAFKSLPSAMSLPSTSHFVFDRLAQVSRGSGVFHIGGLAMAQREVALRLPPPPLGTYSFSGHSSLQIGTAPIRQSFFQTKWTD